MAASERIAACHFDHVEPFGFGRLASIRSITHGLHGIGSTQDFRGTLVDLAPTWRR